MKFNFQQLVKLDGGVFDSRTGLGPPKALRAAYLMAGCALGLIAIGFATAASVAPPEHFAARVQSYGSSLAVAILGFLLTSRIRLDWLRKSAPWIAFVVMGLLLLVLIPQLGHDVKGARRWFSILGFGFQPSAFSAFVGSTA